MNIQVSSQSDLCRYFNSVEPFPFSNWHWLSAAAERGLKPSPPDASDTQVVIQTNEPFAPLLENLAHPGGAILPPGFDPNKPIGSGPYKLEERRSGIKLVLNRNPQYRGALRPGAGAAERLPAPPGQRQHPLRG